MYRYIMLIFCCSFFLLSCSSVDQQLGTTERTKIEQNTALQIAQIQATTVAEQNRVTIVTNEKTNDTNLAIAVDTNQHAVEIATIQNSSYTNWIFYIGLFVIIAVGIYSYFNHKKPTVILLNGNEYNTNQLSGNTKTIRLLNGNQTLIKGHHYDD